MLPRRDVAGSLDIVAAGLPRPRHERLRAHVGLDHAGMDRVDANSPALAGEGERGRLGKQRHAALAHRVERVELRTHEARHRGKVHDRRAVPARLAALGERGGARLGAEPHARHVDGNEAGPLFHGRVHQILAEEHACVVHQNVELAELFGGCGDGGRPGFFRGHVEGERERLAARLGDFSCRLAHALVKHVADDDRGTRRRHLARRLGADAARGTRDQCDLSIQTIHDGVLQ